MLVRKPEMPAVTDESIAFANEVERLSLEQEQIQIATDHVFHAGLYSRTICIPKGVLLTSVQIKIDTVITMCGDCLIMGGPNGAERFTGYHVLRGHAGRKNVYYAIEDTWLTMSFVTSATTVEQAEEEFTEETNKLGSRRVG